VFSGVETEATANHDVAAHAGKKKDSNKKERVERAILVEKGIDRARTFVVPGPKTRKPSRCPYALS
jgi:hypothetical protein